MSWTQNSFDFSFLSFWVIFQAHLVREIDFWPISDQNKIFKTRNSVANIYMSSIGVTEIKVDLCSAKFSRRSFPFIVNDVGDGYNIGDQTSWWNYSMLVTGSIVFVTKILYISTLSSTVRLKYEDTHSGQEFSENDTIPPHSVESPT